MRFNSSLKKLANVLIGCVIFLETRLRVFLLRLYYQKRFQAGSGIHIHKTKIRIGPRGSLILGHGAVLRKSQLFVDGSLVLSGSSSLIGATIRIEPNGHWASSSSRIVNYKISIGKNAKAKVGSECEFSHPSHEKLTLKAGASLEVGVHAKISCKLLVFENACIDFGNYIGIGAGTEIRAMKNVRIGDYALVSYDVNIFDNNSHSTDCLERRKYIENSRIGKTFKEKIEAEGIVIGNDVWIGKNVSVLKGANIGDDCIIGMGAIVPRGSYQSGARIVGMRPIVLV